MGWLDPLVIGRVFVGSLLFLAGWKILLKMFEKKEEGFGSLGCGGSGLGEFPKKF